MILLWGICLILAVISLITFSVLAFTKTKHKKTYTNPYGRMFAGVIISSCVLFLPICLNIFKDTNCGVFEIIFITFHNVIKLFVVDGDFDFIVSNLATDSYLISKGYIILSAMLFVVAPILTFGFVLSFFKNLSSYLNYSRQFFKNAYVFSELNEKSLTLAENILDSNTKNLLVFCSVIEDESFANNELIERAKALGAICFKRDIVTSNFGFHSKRKQLKFFAIGTNQSENINIALKIIEKYKYVPNTNLYVFSTEERAEILIATAFNKDTLQDRRPMLKVRRVNEVRSLIDRILYEDGYEKIFSSAIPSLNGGKNIHALIIGMGIHGIEMTKALSWFCQMSNYYPEIDCFDSQDNTDGKFKSLCPELMSERINGRYDIEGESKNKITIHQNIDVNTKEFEDLITEISPPSYIFISLGDDELNIHTAIKLREVFLRNGYSPQIQAVVSSTEKKEALKDITNFKNQKYNIDFIGDIKTLYSEECIIKSDIEKVALDRHLKWGQEEDFWKFDYNYRSSIASAIHQKMKKLCKIPGIDKAPKERNEEELWNLRILEHCRWNAFMRSEGYVYSGSIEKSSRNDLAKTHHCLVPFKELPLDEQIKDDD